MSDISVEELREFLEADLFEVPVDPEFKEQLKQRLWDLVQSRAPRGPASGRTGSGGSGTGSGSGSGGWEPESGPH